jgi:hypothetical protein
MQRAIVLIGVRKSGTLPELGAVRAGLDHMRDWTRGQGIPDALVATISDDGGRRVRIERIYEAVERFTQRSTLEQLIIYFCGHGVNNGYSEYWLLSDAPANPNEAVNVALSAFFAERCGIPHVVFISDACRTAPAGIQASGVTGSAVFPNNGPNVTTASIDLFYACRLGESSFEIADPTEASDAYHAVYTEVLAQALEGDYPDLIEEADEAEATVGLVRPWPRKRGLPALVTRRIIELNAFLVANQTPDTKVTSDPQVAWLSRLQPKQRIRLGIEERRWDPGNDVVLEPPTVARPATDEASARLARPFGPADVDAPAGIKVRGDRVDTVVTQDGDALLVASRLVEVYPSEPFQTAGVLIRFASGHCAVVPAIAGYLAALTLQDGQLVDVMYQPMKSSPTWDEYQQVRLGYVPYRAALAAASRFGVDSPDAYDADLLLSRYPNGRRFDPSLALYQAYALHDLGRRAMIASIRDDPQLPGTATFFDIQLLARGGEKLVMPSFPLLSRGWALQGAGRDHIGSRTPSHWTLFEGTAFEQLRRSLAAEE